VAAPQLKRGAVAIIDSPRWPRDLDWSQPGTVMRQDDVTGRVIDCELRAIVRELRRAGETTLALSMFPTPRLSYFAGHIAVPSCKPHLRAFGRELFGLRATAPQAPEPLPPTGGTFTRFMLAGFAAYRALEAIQVACYEGYPDLQFRLWCGPDRLPPKASRADALAARRRLLAKLAARLRVGGAAAVGTLDQADAAILALSILAAQSADCGIVVEHPAEGRFWLTLPAGTARLIPSSDDWKLAGHAKA